MLLAWAPTDLQGPKLAGRGSAAVTGLGASRATQSLSLDWYPNFVNFRQT